MSADIDSEGHLVCADCGDHDISIVCDCDNDTFRLELQLIKKVQYLMNICSRCGAAKPLTKAEDLV